MDFNVDYPLEIIRTNRKKTSSVRVLEGKVRLNVPKNFSNEAIASILLRQRGWIEKRIRAQAKIKQAGPKQFIEGERFLYLGRKYKLQIIPKLVATKPASANKVELKSSPLAGDHPGQP